MNPLAYDVHGRDGPFILMVHGILSCRLQWQPNLAALAAVARPVLVELIGHGGSAAPSDPDAYRVAAYVEAFETVRRAVGADRWFVCGQSFAAGLTLAYCLAHPDRVLGQITTNSLSAFSRPGALEATRKVADRAALIEAEGQDAIRRLPFHPRFARRFPADLRNGMEAASAGMAPHALAHAFRVTYPDLSMIDRVNEVRPPGLLVNGLWEKDFQPLRQDLAARAAHWHIVDLEGGHSVNIEAAPGFDAAVTAFIADHA